MQKKKPKNKKWVGILFSLIAGYLLIVGGIVVYNILTDDDAVEGNIVYDAQTLDAMDDATFEKEYAKYLETSFADVPARPLGDYNQKGEDVLVVSNKAYMNKKNETFGDKIAESIRSFFGTKKETKVQTNVSPVAEEMLSEIDGEIAEMQSHFSLYKETNGVTYIDHLNKPMVLESNGFYIYIGVAPNKFTFHRTIIRYSGVDEIDLQRILVQTSVTDRATIIDATENIVQRSVTSAVNEWVDLPPTEENHNLLNAVVSSDYVKVTFMGSLKNIEWELTENELVTLKESLHFYNLLKEKEELSKQ